MIYDKKQIGGIYQIKNLTTNKIYIGSARYVKSRLSQHKRKLRQNLHDNSYLQYAFNKYGENNFKFELIEEVLDFNLIEAREQYWMDFTNCYNREFGYNLRTVAENNKGISRKGYKHTEEAKEKIRHAHLGREHTPEALAKMSAWQIGKPAIKATEAAAKINRKEWKWPHEKGVKCKCDECRRKWNDYLRDWRESKKNDTFIDGNQR